MKLSGKMLSKQAGRFLSDQAPQILTFVGALGVAGTAYFTGKAVLEAREVTFKENALRSQKDGAHAVILTKQEEILRTWKFYVTPAAVGVMTIAAIVAANRVQARRLAAIASAYAVLSGDFDEYREKAAEKLGLKKTSDMNAELAKERINRGPGPIGMLGVGESWFKDASTETVFPCTMETIKRAQNKVNFEVNNFKSSSLNDFYEWMGRPATSIGNILGWNSEKPCELQFEAVLDDEYGAVTEFRFVKGPIPNF